MTEENTTGLTHPDNTRFSVAKYGVPNGSPSLETKLFNALVEKKTVEYMEKFQTPKYTSLIDDVCEGYATSIVSAFKTMIGGAPEMIAGGEEAAEAGEDMAAAIGDQIRTQMKAYFTNPETLKQSCTEMAKSAYATDAEVLAKFKSVQSILIEDKDLPAESISRVMGELNQDVGSANELKKKFLAGLLKIAEKDGLEAALTKQSEYAVTREIFPTKKAYLDHTFGSVQQVKDIFAKTKNLLSAGGEASQFVGNVLGDIGPMIDKIQQAHTDLVYDDAFDKANDIYGVDEPKIVPLPHEKAKELDTILRDRFAKRQTGYT